MKIHKLFVVIAAAGLIGICSCQSPSPYPCTPFVGHGPYCPKSSKDVELYGSYGTREIVKNRVAKIPMNLSERRLFIQITQSGRTNGATTDVKMFEKQRDGSFAVTEWTKLKAPGLFETIDRTIIVNKGTHCVGEAIKNVLVKKFGPGTPAKPLSAHGSAEEAFTPSVEGASDDFVVDKVVFGC
jgi:hypothetical protein